MTLLSFLSFESPDERVLSPDGLVAVVLAALPVVEMGESGTSLESALLFIPRSASFLAARSFSLRAAREVSTEAGFNSECSVLPMPGESGSRSLVTVLLSALVPIDMSTHL